MTSYHLAIHNGVINITVVSHVFFSNYMYYLLHTLYNV